LTWRLDLWNAQLTGTITTSAGQLSIQVLVHDQRPVLVATVTPTAGEGGFRWVFTPEPAISPRADPHWHRTLPAGYAANPPARLTSDGATQLAVQPMTAGGETVTAWQEAAAGSSRTLYLAVAHSFPDTGAQARATGAVRDAVAALPADLLAGHQAGWHAFYRRSFGSFPDQRLQSFYWIQLYKLNSATRANAPIMATMGPWVTTTPWPAVWWDANVQVEYWLLQASNHQELDSVSATFASPANQQNLIDQVPAAYRADSAGLWRETDMFLASGGTLPVPGTTPHPPWETTTGMEVGDLIWGLHNVWLTYRHTLDDGLLRGTLFPLLRRAVNYYLHFLTTGAGGRLHIPATYQPETRYVKDGPYDSTMLRWGCQTLVDLAARLGINDPLAPRWKDVIARLAGSARTLHGVYPLLLLNWEQPASRPFITSLFSGWRAQAAGWNGFFHAWHASVAAQALHGDDALGILNHLLDTLVKPSTMYAEAVIAPVIESPLAGANTVNDMLLQSWGGVVRIFPALPAAWTDVTVHDLRAQGAFLVSAKRTAGVTRFVRVLSLAGQPCLLRTGIPGALAARSSLGRTPALTPVDAQTVRVDVAQSEEVVVYPAGTTPDLTIAPVATPGTFRWGLP
jgi:alpha-L-fucosidase 2